MIATARVRLPFPPSVNNLFMNVGKRRVVTPNYSAWRKQAALELLSQRPDHIAGPVNVRIDLVAPDRRRRDCDNHAKACLDAIVTAGVIEDDSAVRRLSIGWEDEAEAPCTVTITAVERVMP